MGDSERKAQEEREFEELLRTVLYDAGGESVEGAYVDRFEFYANRALDDLERHANQSGLSAREAFLILEALRSPGVTRWPAICLLARLAKHTAPLVREVSADPNPALRAIAAGVAALLDDKKAWERGLSDSDPEVRLAALESLRKSSRTIGLAQPQVLRALKDPDHRARALAAQSVLFFREPNAAAALLELLENEAHAEVRTAILAHIAETVRQEGVHAAPEVVEKGIGPQVRELMLQELANPDADVRRLMASAMERLRGEDVADAMASRLSSETDSEVRRTLALFQGFHRSPVRALSVLAEALAGDADPLVRARAAFAMEGFGPAASDFLLRAIRDVDPNVRRAAAMTLGDLGEPRALPLLVDELSNPESRFFRRETLLAIEDILAIWESGEQQTVTAALSAAIQRRIDALDPQGLGEWPTRVCKEELKSLPIHANILYVWSIKPDGTVLCFDHEAATRNTAPEEDQRTLFAVLVSGARDYPELASLIPPAPKGTRLCRECLGKGWREGASGRAEHCFGCSGLGWCGP